MDALFFSDSYTKVDEDELKKKRKLNNNDELRKFGKHLEGLILKQGYTSTYDFWIQTAGEDISRAGLNYLITGRREPKLLTLILLADLLEISPSDIMDF